MKLTKKSIQKATVGSCLILLFVALASADVSPVPGEDINQEAFEDIDTILNTQLESSEYSETQNCIYTRSYDGIEVIDERHILFKGKRGKAWINQLRHRCPGLTGDKIMVIEMRGSRLCTADTFSAQDKGDNFTIAPLCRFGKFQSVSAEQLPLLHEALAKYAETRTVLKTTQAESRKR